MKIVRETYNSAGNCESCSEDTFFWIVDLFHGSKGCGISTRRELVTKNYERVESLIESWSHLLESGEYFVRVIDVSAKAVTTYCC